jgi:hypothetical protein
MITEVPLRLLYLIFSRYRRTDAQDIATRLFDRSTSLAEAWAEGVGS